MRPKNLTRKIIGFVTFATFLFSNGLGFTDPSVPKTILEVFPSLTRPAALPPSVQAELRNFREANLSAGESSKNLVRSELRLASTHPYKLEAYVSRPLSVLDTYYDLFKDLDPRRKEELKILMVGVGRGVAATELAMRYPNFKITAVNKEKDLWDDREAEKAVRAPYLVQHRQFPQAEFEAARKRIDLKVFDLESEQERNQQLSKGEFDVVIIEYGVLQYMRDRVRVIEAVFNEHVKVGGLYMFEFPDETTFNDLTDFNVADEVHRVFQQSAQVLMSRYREEIKVRKLSGPPAIKIPLTLTGAYRRNGGDEPDDIGSYYAMDQQSPKADSRSELRHTKRNSLIERLIGESDLSKQLEISESLGLDVRPAHAGLLDPLHVLYDMAVKSVVNPDGRAKTALYRGAGADVSNFLLSTNVQHVDFEASYYGLREKDLAALPKIKADSGSFYSLVRFYVQSKFTSGYGMINSHDTEDYHELLITKEGIVSAVAAELYAMGVDFESVAVDRDERGYPRISFDWNYVGSKKRRYSISFLDIETGSRKLRYADNYDLYYQRAGQTIAAEYKNQPGRILDVYDRVRPGGFLVTDDIGVVGRHEYFDFSRNFPLILEKKVVDLLPVVRQALMHKLYQFYHGMRDEEGLRYGWDVTIRQKPKDSKRSELRNVREELARSELRSVSDPKVAKFSQTEIDLMSKRIELIKIAYPYLSREAKKVLLYPSFLLTFLGIKPFYLATTMSAGREPSPLLLRQELERVKDAHDLVNGQILLTQSFALSIDQVAHALGKRKEFLKKMNVLRPEDDETLALIESNLSENMGKFGALLQTLMRSRFSDHSPEHDALLGVLFGFPDSAIEAVTHHFDESKVASFPFRDINLRFIPGASGEMDPDSRQYLARVEAALLYAYTAVREFAGFSDLVREMKLPEAILVADRPSISLRQPPSIRQDPTNPKRSELRNLILAPTFLKSGHANGQPSVNDMLGLLERDQVHAVLDVKVGDLGFIFFLPGKLQREYWGRFLLNVPFSENEVDRWRREAKYSGWWVSKKRVEKLAEDLDLNVSSHFMNALAIPPSAQELILISRYTLNPQRLLLEETIHHLEGFNGGQDGGISEPHFYAAREIVNDFIQLMFVPSSELGAFLTGYNDWSLEEKRSLRDLYVNGREPLNPNYQMREILLRLSDDLGNYKQLSNDVALMDILIRHMAKPEVARYHFESPISSSRLAYAVQIYLELLLKRERFSEHKPIFPSWKFVGDSADDPHSELLVTSRSELRNFRETDLSAGESSKTENDAIVSRAELRNSILTHETSEQWQARNQHFDETMKVLMEKDTFDLGHYESATKEGVVEIDVSFHEGVHFGYQVVPKPSFKLSSPVTGEHGISGVFSVDINVTDPRSGASKRIGYFLSNIGLESSAVMSEAFFMLDPEWRGRGLMSAVMNLLKPLLPPTVKRVKWEVANLESLMQLIQLLAVKDSKWVDQQLDQIPGDNVSQSDFIRIISAALEDVSDAGRARLEYLTPKNLANTVLGQLMHRLGFNVQSISFVKHGETKELELVLEGARRSELRERTWPISVASEAMLAILTNLRPAMSNHAFMSVFSESNISPLTDIEKRAFTELIQSRWHATTEASRRLQINLHSFNRLKKTILRKMLVFYESRFWEQPIDPADQSIFSVSPSKPVEQVILGHLFNGKLFTLMQLSRLTERELALQRGIGTNAIEIIKKWLSEKGLVLKPANDASGDSSSRAWPQARSELRQMPSVIRLATEIFRIADAGRRIWTPKEWGYVETVARTFAAEAIAMQRPRLQEPVKDRLRQMLQSGRLISMEDIDQLFAVADSLIISYTTSLFRHDIKIATQNEIEKKVEEVKRAQELIQTFPLSDDQRSLYLNVFIFIKMSGRNVGSIDLPDAEYENTFLNQLEAAGVDVGEVRRRAHFHERFADGNKPKDLILFHRRVPGEIIQKYFPEVSESDRTVIAEALQNMSDAIARETLLKKRNLYEGQALAMIQQRMFDLRALSGINPEVVENRFLTVPQANAYAKLKSWFIAQHHNTDQVVYPFSATDIITALAVTDAKVLRLYDALPFGFDTDPSSKDLKDLKEIYRASRAANGFIHHQMVWVIKNAKSPILWELEALGASNIRVAKGGKNGIYHIDFDWSYDGKSRPVRRQIIYHEWEANRLEDAAGIVNPQDSVYLHKAAMTFGVNSGSLPPIVIAFDDTRDMHNNANSQLQPSYDAFPISKLVGMNSATLLNVELVKPGYADFLHGQVFIRMKNIGSRGESPEEHGKRSELRESSGEFRFPEVIHATLEKLKVQTDVTIFIDGQSNTGKTTFARELADELRAHKLTVSIVSGDNEARIRRPIRELIHQAAQERAHSRVVIVEGVNVVGEARALTAPVDISILLTADFDLRASRVRDQMEVREDDAERIHQSIVSLLTTQDSRILHPGQFDFVLDNSQRSEMRSEDVDQIIQGLGGMNSAMNAISALSELIGTPVEQGDLLAPQNLILSRFIKGLIQKSDISDEKQALAMDLIRVTPMSEAEDFSTNQLKRVRRSEKKPTGATKKVVAKAEEIIRLHGYQTSTFENVIPFEDDKTLDRILAEAIAFIYPNADVTDAQIADVRTYFILENLAQDAVKKIVTWSPVGNAVRERFNESSARDTELARQVIRGSEPSSAVLGLLDLMEKMKVAVAQKQVGNAETKRGMAVDPAILKKKVVTGINYHYGDRIFPIAAKDPHIYAGVPIDASIREPLIHELVETGIVIPHFLGANKTYHRYPNTFYNSLVSGRYSDFLTEAWMVVNAREYQLSDYEKARNAEIATYHIMHMMMNEMDGRGVGKLLRKGTPHYKEFEFYADQFARLLQKTVRIGGRVMNVQYAITMMMKDASISDKDRGEFFIEVFEYFLKLVENGPSDLNLLLKKSISEKAPSARGTSETNFETWFSDRYLPSVIPLSDRVVEGSLTGRELSDWIKNVVQEIAPEFVPNVQVSDDAIVDEGAMIDIGLQIIEEVMLPRGYFLGQSNQGIAFAKVVNKETVKSPSGRDVPVYTIDSTMPMDPAMAYGNYVVLKRMIDAEVKPYRDIVLMGNILGSGKLSWDELKKTFGRKASDSFYQLVDLWVALKYLSGAKSDSEIESRLHHDALGEELAHSDTLHFVQSLWNRRVRHYKGVYFNDVIKLAREILRPGSAVPGFFKDQNSEEFGEGVNEIEASLKAMQFGLDPSFAFVRSLRGSSLAGSQAGREYYAKASDAVLTMLSLELFGKSTLDKTTWTQYLDGQMGDLNGFNEKLRAAAKVIGDREFLTYAEREERIKSGAASTEQNRSELRSKSSFDVLNVKTPVLGINRTRMEALLRFLVGKHPVNEELTIRDHIYPFISEIDDKIGDISRFPGAKKISEVHFPHIVIEQLLRLAADEEYVQLTSRPFKKIYSFRLLDKALETFPAQTAQEPKKIYENARELQMEGLLKYLTKRYKLGEIFSTHLPAEAIDKEIDYANYRRRIVKLTDATWSWVTIGMIISYAIAKGYIKRTGKKSRYELTEKAFEEFGKRSELRTIEAETITGPAKVFELSFEESKSAEEQLKAVAIPKDNPVVFRVIPRTREQRDYLELLEFKPVGDKGQAVRASVADAIRSRKLLNIEKIDNDNLRLTFSAPISIGDSKFTTLHLIMREPKRHFHHLSQRFNRFIDNRSEWSNMDSINAFLSYLGSDLMFIEDTFGLQDEETKSVVAELLEWNRDVRLVSENTQAETVRRLEEDARVQSQREFEAKQSELAAQLAAEREMRERGRQQAREDQREAQLEENRRSQIPRFVESMIDYFREFASHEGRMPLDLSQLVAAAQKISPEYASVIAPEKLRAANAETINEFLSEINKRVLTPKGHVLGLIAVDQRMSQIFYATVKPDAPEEIEYLGEMIPIVPVQKRKGALDMGGIVIDGVIYFDPVTAALDAVNFYQLLIQGPLTQYASVARLNEKMNELKIYNPLVYGQHFGANRSRYYWIQRAKDSRFTMKIAQSRGVDASKLSWNDEMDWFVKALLRPESKFRGSIARLSESYDQSYVRYFTSRLTEISDQVGGLIMEMEAYLKSDNPKKQDFAYAAFLDFISFHMMKAEFGKDHDHKSFVESMLNFPSRMIMNAFYDLEREKIKDLDDLIAYAESGPETPAERSLALMKRIFSLDFYTDEERAQLLNLATDRLADGRSELRNKVFAPDVVHSPIYAPSAYASLLSTSVELASSIIRLKLTQIGADPLYVMEDFLGMTNGPELRLGGLSTCAAAALVGASGEWMLLAHHTNAIGRDLEGRLTAERYQGVARELTAKTGIAVNFSKAIGTILVPELLPSVTFDSLSVAQKINLIEIVKMAISRQYQVPGEELARTIRNPESRWTQLLISMLPKRLQILQGDEENSRTTRNAARDGIARAFAALGVRQVSVDTNFAWWKNPISLIANKAGVVFRATGAPGDANPLRAINVKANNSRSELRHLSPVPIPVLSGVTSDSQNKMPALSEKLLKNSESRIDWNSPDGTTIDARVDSILRRDGSMILHLAPMQSERDAHAHLDALDIEGDVPQLPHTGTFGRMMMKQVMFENEPAILIEEIHVSRGFHYLSDDLRKRYREWISETIRYVATVASESGFRHVIVNSNETIREENPHRPQDRPGYSSISDKSLYEHYIRPFRGKALWNKIEISDGSSAQKRKYWYSSVDSLVRREAKSELRRVVSDAMQAVSAGPLRAELEQAMDVSDKIRETEAVGLAYDHRFMSEGYTSVIGAYAKLRGEPVVLVWAMEFELNEIRDINQALGPIMIDGKPVDPILPAHDPQEAASILRSFKKSPIYIVPEGAGISPLWESIFSQVVEFSDAQMKRLALSVEPLLEAIQASKAAQDLVAQMA